MHNILHVVSFDNPFPPNYGGVIDVYFKLLALNNTGVRVHLHVFEYGRQRYAELEECCEKVSYYPRRTFVNPFVGTLPYIVSTRNDQQLLQNLLLDDAPILFEGLHSCFFLSHPALANRFKMVRMHNIEHDYYRKLEEVERNFFKKYFFSKEAQRLQQFEQVLQHAQVIWAISPSDYTTLSSRYQSVQLLPAFHANTEVTALEGTGEFAFYHGNLSVGENDEAACYLVREVFNEPIMPLVIAGNKPSPMLVNLVQQQPHVTLLENVTTEKINELTRDAQLNVLPTFQSTGIKLKLINVLYQGRWVIANAQMVNNTGLADLCIQADHAAAMKQAIIAYRNQPITAALLQQRASQLTQLFSNSANVEKLVSSLPN